MTGIICINKHSDITSFGVVAKVRGITREKKVGHTGTLDPMATGVLPVMLGGATKFLNYLPDSDKGYLAKFKLGITTDTLDITGNVLSECSVTATYTDVENALQNFVGNIMQVPPMYSAKSVDGVRLYDLARRGVDVEREPCPVCIKSIQLVGFDNSEYTIDVLCSKGTYIRSLISDIGASLGCGAVMTQLVRTKAMGFTLDDCISIDDLQNIKDNGGSFDSVLHSVQDMFKCYKNIYVSSAQANRFANGGALDINRLKTMPPLDTPCNVYNDNEFLGLGQSNGIELKVLRLLSKKD